MAISLFGLGTAVSSAGEDTEFSQVAVRLDAHFQAMEQVGLDLSDLQPLYDALYDGFGEQRTGRRARRGRLRRD